MSVSQWPEQPASHAFAQLQTKALSPHKSDIPDLIKGFQGCFTLNPKWWPEGLQVQLMFRKGLRGCVHGRS